MQESIREVLARLLTLQEQDTRILKLEEELQRIPKEEASSEQRYQGVRSQWEAARRELQQLEVERKRLELEAETLRGRIAKYKVQQMQTRKNEEYQALGHEIEIASQEVSRIEDQELAVMERADALKSRVKELEARVSAEKAVLEQEKKILEEKKEALRRELEQSRLQVKAAEEALPEELLRRYRRIWQARKPLAVAPVTHESCGGCHMKIPRQTVLDVRSERRLVHCENCGRFLYWAGEPGA